MKQHEISSIKRLSLVWLILIVLTLSSMIGARVDIPKTESLTPFLCAFIFLLSLFKAQAILMEFMNLRLSSKVWKTSFFCVMFCLISVLFLITIF
jgi:cytochrome c oxidase subunit IV